MPLLNIKTMQSSEVVDSTVHVPLDNLYIGNTAVCEFYMEDKEHNQICVGDTEVTNKNLQVAYASVDNPSEVFVKTYTSSSRCFEIPDNDKDLMWSVSLYGKANSTRKLFSCDYGESEEYIPKDNFYYINLDRLDTSDTYEMDAMFEMCMNLTELDLSKLDTHNVSSLSFMFNLCSDLETLNLSNINLEKCTNISYLLNGCRSLTNLNINGIDTSNVTNMQYVFSNCSNLTKLDVSNFDTSSCDTIRGMFLGCNKLTSIDISNFDTSLVNNMAQLFSMCQKLTTIKLGTKFTTSNVTDISYMFNGCTALTNPPIDKIDTSNVTRMNGVFRNCTGITELIFKSWDVSNVYTMDSMFSECSNLQTLYLINWNTSSLQIPAEMFNNCSSLTTIYANKNFDTSNVTDSQKWFYGCDSLQGQFESFNSVEASSDFYASIVTSEGKCGMFTFIDPDNLTYDGYVARPNWTNASGKYGNVYIYTGIPASSKIKVVARGKFSKATGGSIVGVYANTVGETKQFRLFNYSSKWYLDYGSGEGYNRIKGGTWTLNQDYTFEFGNRYVKAFNHTTNTNLGTVISGSTVSSFSYSNQIITLMHDSGASGSFKFVNIFENNVLKMSLIPVMYQGFYEGMYDIVNNKFYQQIPMANDGASNL